MNFFEELRFCSFYVSLKVQPAVSHVSDQEIDFWWLYLKTLIFLKINNFFFNCQCPSQYFKPYLCKLYKKSAERFGRYNVTNIYNSMNFLETELITKIFLHDSILHFYIVINYLLLLKVSNDNILFLTFTVFRSFTIAVTSVSPTSRKKICNTQPLTKSQCTCCFRISNSSHKAKRNFLNYKYLNVRKHDCDYLRKRKQQKQNWAGETIKTRTLLKEKCGKFSNWSATTILIKYKTFKPFQRRFFCSFNLDVCLAG